MDQVVETIFQSFLNAAVPPVKFEIKDSTFLAQLGFDENTYVLCSKYLSDVLGELFPDVESGVPKLVHELKAVMLASLVRTRDRLDKARPCAECGKLPDFASRCSRCKAVVYCSRECQTAHWKSHKKQCTPPTEQSDLGFLSLQRQQPPIPEHGLTCVFAHSADKIDTNLVIVIHGNGDNEVNFLRFAGKLNLPLSAMLSVRGPLPVGMQGQMWYPEVEGFQPSPENRLRTKPLWEAGELVAAQMRLAEKSGWPAHRIFLLGHGHGGVVAVDAARKFGKTAGGVVASGDAVLEEALMNDPVPTRVEKHVQDLQLGDTLNFMQLSIEFVSSQPLEDDETKWSYDVVAVEAAATTAGKAKVKPFRVLFDQLDFGNPRARPKVIELFEKRFHVRFSQLHRDSCRVEVDAIVPTMEEMDQKSGTPVFFTTGELDKRIQKGWAELQLQYLRRKFRIVEYRRFKHRKDVLGSDVAELQDIYAFLLLCSANKPRLEPPQIRQLGTGRNENNKKE